MSDLIRREDAIDAIGADIDEIDAFDPSAGIMKACIRRAIWKVMGVPSADRPQGEWIDAEIPLESGDTMPIQVCNLCKTFYPLAYTGGGHRFCPNCGARMLAKDTNVPNKKGADDE